jgi:hypothetical protein
VAEPRFVASTVQRLVDLARAADPPVREGDRATLLLERRAVLLEAHVRDDAIEWIEIEEVSP